MPANTSPPKARRTGYALEEEMEELRIPRTDALAATDDVAAELLGLRLWSCLHE